MSTIAQSERRWQKEKILFFSLSFTKMHYHVLLALLGKAPGLDYEYQAVEVKEVAFRFDGVMRPAVESASQPTIFVEVQFQLDEYFYHRFFAEIFLFLRKNPDVEHWQAVVLFEKRSRETDKQPPFRVLLDSPQVRCLYLEDLQDTVFDSIELSVLQLIMALLRELSEKRSVLL